MRSKYFIPGHVTDSNLLSMYILSPKFLPTQSSAEVDLQSNFISLTEKLNLAKLYMTEWKMTSPAVYRHISTACNSYCIRFASIKFLIDRVSGIVYSTVCRSQCEFLRIYRNWQLVSGVILFIILLRKRVDYFINSRDYWYRKETIL